jgi:hypothetical protein
MRPGLLALALLAAIATQAGAAETSAWPPEGATAERMKQLQQVLHDRQASAVERENARRELAKLLKSPAGQARATPDEKPTRPARAAVDPLPTIFKSTVIPAVPGPSPSPAGAPGVARLEVVPPPQPVANPRTGIATSPPAGGFAIDPKSGHVLHQGPAGYVDPKTGQIVR